MNLLTVLMSGRSIDSIALLPMVGSVKGGRTRPLIISGDETIDSNARPDGNKSRASG
jgi:hypothetical protein